MQRGLCRSYGTNSREQAARDHRLVKSIHQSSEQVERLASLEGEPRALAAQLGPLERREKELEAELANVQAELETAHQTLAAAAGGAVKQKSAKVPRKKRAKQKASASREEVVAATKSLIKKHKGKATKKALLEDLKEKLQAEGKRTTELMQQFNKLVERDFAVVLRGRSVAMMTKQNLDFARISA